MTQPPSSAAKALPRGAATDGQTVTDVEDVVVKTDTRTPIRVGFWVLVVGFGLFMAWAAFAPLDQGVVAPATVSIEQRRTTVQHLQGGIVRELKVRDGQRVKAGDVLIVLDDATTRATYESIRQAYLSQRAFESRLRAELIDARAIDWHPDLMAGDDPQATQHMVVQQQVFDARRAALAAELSAGRQSIAGLEGQIRGLNEMRGSRSAQVELLSRQLANVRALADEGFAPRNQVLQLEQAEAERRAALAELDTAMERARSAIAETRLRIAQRQQEYAKEVSSQLAEVSRDVEANQERLTAITGDLGRMQVRAPVDGQVVALQAAGIGSVVTPGQRLLDIVPHGAPLLLDAKVPPHVIDRVAAGDVAEVRFSSFADQPRLVVTGRVVSLAGDAVTEALGSVVQSYYLARVELTEEGLKALQGRNLQPGMPAEVLIKTGERSLLTYLLHPLVKRVAAAMTEE